MSAKEILEISNQSYSSLLCDFQICERCSLVDKFFNIKRYDSNCPVCNKHGNGGKLYFNFGVRSLIDLMQEVYNSKRIISNIDDEKMEVDSRAHYLSVIIFFITLREVLLQNFLDEVALIKNIPNSDYELLLSDNWNYSQKQNKLFKSLLNIKWEKAVEQANEKDEIDYLSLDKLLKKAVDTRNKFLHEGKSFIITKELAEECIINISSLINLYVRFHNDYVHPFYLDKVLKSDIN